MPVNCDLTISASDNFVSGEKISSLCDVSIYEKNHIETFDNIKKNCKKIIFANDKVDDNIKQTIKESKSFFVKTDHVVYFEKSILPHIDHKFILVTHNSDRTSGNNQGILNNKYLIKWFGQNMIKSEKTEALPIGLENSCWKGWDFNICKINLTNPKDKLLYLNFSLKTNKERKNTLNTIIANGFSKNESLEWKDYIKLLSEHKFCVSPLGNGADCHRTWEAIYVGCIPIIEKHPILYEHFRELPILFVDDYSNITEEFLNSEYIKFKENKSLTEKGKLCYWKMIFDNVLSNDIKNFE